MLKTSPFFISFTTKIDRRKIALDLLVPERFLGTLVFALKIFLQSCTSFLKDSLNKQIFSKDINIIDDPKIIKGLGSRPFDGEGLKTNKKEEIPVFVHSHHIHQHEKNEKFGIKSPIFIDHLVCF